MRKTSNLVRKGGFFEKAGTIVILVVLREKKTVLFEDLVALSTVSRSTVALRTKEFQELGWITKEEMGRNSRYELTKEGEKIADKAIELIEEAIRNSDKKMQINLLNALLEKTISSIQDFKSIVSVVEEISEKKTRILEGKFEQLQQLKPISMENMDDRIRNQMKVAQKLKKEIKEILALIDKEGDIYEKIPNFKNSLETRYKKVSANLNELISIAKNLSLK